MMYTHRIGDSCHRLAGMDLVLFTHYSLRDFSDPIGVDTIRDSLDAFCLDLPPEIVRVVILQTVLDEGYCVASGLIVESGSGSLYRLKYGSAAEVHEIGVKLAARDIEKIMGEVMCSILGEDFT